MLDIITCCNDTRRADLERLARSIDHHAPGARLRVIPFDDNMTETLAVMREVGAELQPVLPVWTQTGRRLFHGAGAYRPGTPKWRYFSKLNMFNDITGPTLYLDANCVLLSGEPLPDLSDHDILFHSSAAPGRNFSEAGAFIRDMAPALREGYNLGHCVFGPVAARKIREFARIVPGFHRAYLGPAPEQSFLTYAIAFLGLRSGLLHDIDPSIAPTNDASGRAIYEEAGIFRYTSGNFRDMRLISAKRPGTARMTKIAESLFTRYDAPAD